MGTFLYSYASRFTKGDIFYKERKVIGSLGKFKTSGSMSAIETRVIDNLQSYPESKRDAEKERQSRRSAHELYEVDVEVENLSNGEDEEFDCAYLDLENGVDYVTLTFEGVEIERSIETTTAVKAFCTRMCVKAVACNLEPGIGGERRIQSVTNDESDEKGFAGKISVEFGLLKSTMAARRRRLVLQESGHLQIRNPGATSCERGERRIRNDSGEDFEWD